MNLAKINNIISVFFFTLLFIYLGYLLGKKYVDQNIGSKYETENIIYNQSTIEFELNLLYLINEGYIEAADHLLIRRLKSFRPYINIIECNELIKTMDGLVDKNTICYEFKQK